MPEKWEKEGWHKSPDRVTDLRGVTPEMIDWWFDNMEKGYLLWHPTEHFGFEWEVPPGEVGHVGAVQVIWEKFGDDLNRKIRIKYEDASLCPIPLICDHVCVTCAGYRPDGQLSQVALHQWEATDFGSRHIMTGIWREPTPFPKAVTSPKNGPTHSEVEMARLAEFLPQLWKMWQVVKNPQNNPQPNLKVKMLTNGEYAYITDNKFI